MPDKESSPGRGHATRRYPHPVPAVDIIIEYQNQGLVLIRRANPPLGWALPGGFVEYAESLEAAAVREAREETGLEVDLLGQLHTYSDPDRDPRGHVITTVFVARGHGTPRAADDARELAVFPPGSWPQNLAFDHAQILSDYLEVRQQWLSNI